MKVIIAEKPSVAREIARVVGADFPGMDYYSGGGYCVTWCYGHLLEIHAKEEAGGWSVDSLPLIPRGFFLSPVQERGADGKMHEGRGIKERLDVIKGLFDRCDGIVVATDAGREGELIFRRVYNYLGCRKPFERLWISSLTEQPIAEGMAHLLPGSSKDNLAAAAEQRSQADWIVGINATRAFTLASGYRQVLSLGRVQTPTLCMVCRRYVENRDFKSEPFWFIEGESQKDGVAFKWRGKDRYDNKDNAIMAYGPVKGSGLLKVQSVTTERKNEAPPLLHDIASLQKAANGRYGYTADETLKAAQSLYEKKLITYPRTGSRYIPEDVFSTIPKLLRSLSWSRDYAEMASTIAAGGHLNRRSVNDAKITDHHALLVTGNEPKGLSDRESAVFDLVLTRVLEAFSPVSVADVTAVELLSAGVLFETKGRKDVALGWRAVCKTGDYEDVELKDVDEVEMSMRPLPEMKEGDIIAIGKIELIEDKTKPKPLLTDATLLSAMEAAGRKSDDKEVVAALREIGIGTPATRAEIIETLVRRGYVNREKKKLVPTPLGLEVYGAVRDKDVANVELTARWEIALDDIAEGKSAPIEFARGIRDFTRRITKELLEADDVKALSAKMDAYSIKCPKCGSTIRLGEKTAWCKSCNLTVYRNVAGKKLSDSAMTDLLTKGKTRMLSGFKSKSGKEFSAAVELMEDGKTRLEFPKRKES